MAPTSKQLGQAPQQFPVSTLSRGTPPPAPRRTPQTLVALATATAKQISQNFVLGTGGAAAAPRAMGTGAAAGTTGTTRTARANATSGVTTQELTNVTNTVVNAVNANRGAGVGQMSQVALSTAVAELSRLPGFKNPDGSVNHQKVMDYAIALCGNVFTGKQALKEGLDRIPGRDGNLYAIIDSMPDLTAAQVGGDVGTWRATLDTSNGKSSLLADFDDGSGGQARHTWVYIVMGYAAPANALSQTVLLAGNFIHEGVESGGGGSRQDFAAGWAGGAYGQMLRMLRDVMNDPNRNSGYDATLLGRLGPMTGEFFTGTGDGGAIAAEALRNMWSIPAGHDAYLSLPWVDTGRRDESQLAVNR